MEFPGSLPTAIPEGQADEIKKTIAESGMHGLMTYVKGNLDRWKKVPLNIAVTGNSGSGKSSFINSIRGLSADDKGAAAVDVVESTMIPTPYPHPDNENLQIWDLPGVGTQKYSKDSYLDAIKFEQYDFFLILASGRFTENDIWLAKRVRDQDKKFFFVRTKMEMDIMNDKMSHPKTHNPQTVLQKIRSDCEANFESAGIKNASDIIYLIDNHQRNEYQFGKLSASLISSAPTLKREAMALSLSGMTRDIILMKKDALKARAWKVALLSASAGAVPIPGVGAAVDTVLICGEALFYRNQLGLCPEDLQKSASELGISLDELKERAKLNVFTITFTAQGIAKVCGALLASEAIESGSKLFLPIIGSIIAATISYGGTYASLNMLLDMFVDDAIKINGLMKDHLSSQSMV